jgi:hypothetical protein
MAAMITRRIETFFTCVPPVPAQRHSGALARLAVVAHTAADTDRISAAAPSTDHKCLSQRHFEACEMLRERGKRVKKAAKKVR